METSSSPRFSPRKDEGSPPSSLPEEKATEQPRGWLHPMKGRLSNWASEQLNFYRIHVLVFTFVPLIASGIFYAANGSVHIDYIDCLFVCVTSMTVTGLTTINISTCTGFQQAMLFFLMCIGNLSAVSVTMVWIRRHFFRKKFDHMIRNDPRMRKRAREAQKQIWQRRQIGLKRVQNLLSRAGGGDKEKYEKPLAQDASEKRAEQQGKGGKKGLGVDFSSPSGSTSSGTATKEKKRLFGGATRKGPLTADMIRRADQPAVLMNSSIIPSKLGEEPTSASAAPPTSGGGGILSNPISSPHEGEGGDASGLPSGRRDSMRSRKDSSNQYPSIRIALPDESGVGGSGRRYSLAVGDDSGTEEDGGSYMKALQRSAARAARAQRSGAPRDEDAQELDIEDSADDPTSAGLRTSRSADPVVYGRSHRRRGSEGANFSPRSAPAEPTHDPLPRAQTIGFAEPAGSHVHQSRTDRLGNVASGYSSMPTSAGAGGNVLRHRSTGLEFERSATRRSTTGGSVMLRKTRTSASGLQLYRTMTSTKNTGFGGWPSPIDVIRYILEKVFHRKEMPRTSTIASTHSGGGLGGEGVRTAPYFSFDVLVSRNSKFHELTEEQQDELGGVEYRAIDLLAKLIPAYWLLVNFFFITLVAPYANSIAYNKYNSVFESQGAFNPNRTWWVFFNTVSAYTNTGLSLIDTSMTQQQDAYLPLVSIAALILLGNTAFPIALRCFIWVFSKLTPTKSRVHESLRFLLDHPRRCFVYLFPSGQTWFLLCVLIFLNCVDWVMFLILDLGNPVIDSIPTGQRVFDGLFQSIAVRAAGFQVVSLLTLAPAVQVLYTVMMYISVFPIAMSVRSTNVYEEKSLGIFEEITDKEEEPKAMEAKVWSKYLAAHARRQLAFDMWWLGFALWLVCIIQKSEIEDPNSNGWFTIFSVLFELTSAYGTVGLSTGTPYDNFSLSGRFNTLGKLVVIAVMLRGRHRGLPVAIDRAILLPDEVEAEDQSAAYSVVDDGFDDDYNDYDYDPSFGHPSAVGTGLTKPYTTSIHEEPETYKTTSPTNTANHNEHMAPYLRNPQLSVINEKATPSSVPDQNPLSLAAPVFSDSPTNESSDKDSNSSKGISSAADDSPVGALSGPAASSIEGSGPSSSEGPTHADVDERTERAFRQRYGSDPGEPLVEGG